MIELLEVQPPLAISVKIAWGRLQPQPSGGQTHPLALGQDKLAGTLSLHKQYSLIMFSVYPAGNAPYVNRSEAVNRRRRLLSYLIVAQSSTIATIHVSCAVCRVHVCILLCRVFMIAVYLGNKVTSYPLSPLTSQVTVLKKKK